MAHLPVVRWRSVVSYSGDFDCLGGDRASELVALEISAARTRAFQICGRRRRTRSLKLSIPAGLPGERRSAQKRESLLSLMGLVSRGGRLLWIDPMSSSIEATLRYCVDTGVKAVTETVGPGGRLRRRSGGQDDLRTVELHDARPVRAQLSLEREGFELLDAPSAVEDFWDEAQLRSIYYAETAALVAARCGARRVEVFDHTLRSQDPARQAEHFAREPVEVVHNDYTERSGPWRVEELLADEAEALLTGRVAIVQVWRPLREPVQSYPLALCDAQSVSAAELIAAERRHPHRVGEIYQLSFAPTHRWYYFPLMRCHEVLMFKVYDSLSDGRARFTPHSSFQAPGTPDGAIRESIELRTLVFW